MDEALNAGQPQQPVQPLPTPTTAPQIGGKLLEKLQALVDKIEILRVTTVIGTITNGQVIPTPDGLLKVSYNAAPNEVACTTINMALGDVNNVRSQAFADNAAYAKLHDDNLALARAVRSETMDIIMKGLAAVEALFKK